MPNQITIRRITENDDQVIASIIRSSLEEFGAAKPGTVYFDETTDHLHEVFKQDGSAYFIAEEESKILGGAGIFPTDGLPEHTCELVKMYLSKEARGKGLGKLLLATCIEEARKTGYKQIYIETMPELKNAISMYNNAGFKVIEKPMGNSGHEGCTVFMIKDL